MVTKVFTSKTPHFLGKFRQIFLEIFNWSKIILCEKHNLGNLFKLSKSENLEKNPRIYVMEGSASE